VGRAAPDAAVVELVLEAGHDVDDSVEAVDEPLGDLRGAALLDGAGQGDDAVGDRHLDLRRVDSQDVPEHPGQHGVADLVVGPDETS
jgi:hypothetical protein